MIQMEGIRKLAWFVNTVLLGFVILMAGIFAHFGVTYMVYHSIPTVVVYLFFYYMIHKKWLDIYVWCVYFVITIYMIAATICLGYNYGFHLYCMSLIPLTFYMQYMSYQLHTRKTRAMEMSIALVLVYLISSTYAVVHGPIYEINMKAAVIFLNINAASVFAFLIGYTNMSQNFVLNSEAKLSEMAHTDQLTGLFNRHYLIDNLEKFSQFFHAGQWVAMIDIDNFKAINDNYGHSGGDYVLIELGKILQDTCKGCMVTRWGGEEFLITTNKEKIDSHILEQLRQTVEQAQFTYRGKDITVTITIGVSNYQEGQSFDNWVRDADNKLYAGKNKGKNQVVYEIK